MESHCPGLRIYDVYVGLPPDPPTLGDPPPEVQLQLGDMFVFNCTPIPGNPVEVNITFRKDGSPVTLGGSVTVDGPLLTIASVQRSDTGNYSCTVSNTAGMTALYHSLTVVGGCGEGSGEPECDQGCTCGMTVCFGEQ